MRIALVGPTHPYKGGVSAHTTRTAQHLADAGHEVDLVSWARLYPAALYPGEQTVADGGPDVPPYPGTTRPLRWDRPWSWWRTGATLRGHDLVVVVVVVPAQVPMLLAVVRAARRGPGAGATTRGGTEGGDAPRPRVAVLAHNVVPHETHAGGRWLMTRMLAAADAVLVHSQEQGRLAREHHAPDVVVADLPPHLPGGDPAPADVDAVVSRRLARLDGAAPDVGGIGVLALGVVRHYKGLDLLLQAAREVPQVRVTVAGEQWGRAGERVRELAADPDLAGRVSLVPGYVPGVEVPGLLAAHDVLALPYRSATSSQNVLLARAHGLPVVATTVGTFAAQVRDGVDGVLADPEDVDSLVAALRRMVAPGALAAMVRASPRPDLAAPWQPYITALADLGTPARSRP